MTAVASHEEAILSAIASGASVEYLINKWPVGDVTDVLRRNHLCVDPQGRPCPTDGRADVVLRVLRHHESLHVRRRAEAAERERDALLALFRELQDHHGDAQKLVTTRDANNAYINWLSKELDAAIKFGYGLKTPKEAA